MNILLWILQILLAIWNLIGGLYTMEHFDQLKGGLGDGLPQPAWVAICLLQILFALGLVLPGLVKGSRKLIPLSAFYLALYALSGCLLFAQYAGFPGMLWGVIPAILAGFVALGRFERKPR